MRQIPLLTRLVANCYNISSKAAEIVYKIRKSGNLEIIDKGVNDLQTLADRESQALIVNSLEKMYPKIKVIGEEELEQNETEVISSLSKEVLEKCENLPEEYTNVKEEELVIWVDPLDGTNEFTIGMLEHVTILIGVARFGKPIAGIICQPFFKNKESQSEECRIVWGIVGLGSFGLFPSKNQQDLVITTSRSHPNVLSQKCIDACKPSDLLKLGGAGNKILNVIEGNAHAYVYASRGTKKWDTCSPEAIIRANGGILTDICGIEYSYDENVMHENKTGILATATVEMHERLKKCIPDDVKTEIVK